MGLFSTRATTEELRAEAETVQRCIASEKAADAVRPNYLMHADTNLASYQHRLAEINEELNRR